MLGDAESPVGPDDAPSITGPRLFAVVFVPLLVLYLLTATWERPYHIDPFSNALPAWNLASSGSFHLDQHTQLASVDYYSNVGWVVPARDSVASQYPPGTALLAAPLYAVWPEDASLEIVSGSNNPDAAAVEILLPPFGPAAILASVAVAVAMALLGLVFRAVGATPTASIVGAYLAGLGTSAWSVGADQLWQHGPAMMWIALGLLLSARQVAGSGFAFALSVLTRPPTALVPASIGLYRSWKERSVKPALLIGFGSAIGLIAFLAYNQLIFGSFSVSAGYGEAFRDNALSLDVAGYLRNVFRGALSATRGFLIWSPFLLVLLPGMRAGWKVASTWVRGAAIGGVLYLLHQYKANRFSGGSGFFTYRYPLEALTAAAPLLYLSFKEWVSVRPRMMWAFFAMAAVSVAIHGLGGFDIISM